MILELEPSSWALHRRGTIQKARKGAEQAGRASPALFSIVGPKHNEASPLVPSVLANLLLVDA